MKLDKILRTKTNVACVSLWNSLAKQRSISELPAFLRPYDKKFFEVTKLSMSKDLVQAPVCKTFLPQWNFSAPWRNSRNRIEYCSKNDKQLFAHLFFHNFDHVFFW